GIAGMQMFDGSLGVPLFVDKRLVWMTPDWKDAFRHGGAEGDRLGLEMAMAAWGGWSETAGPWVKPEEGMKKVVWSETRVEGPRKFTGVLSHPPTVNGRFQDMPIPPDFEFPMPTDLPGAKPMPPSPPPSPDPTYYADTVVLAYRFPDDEMRIADAQPHVTTSGGDIDAAALVDGSFGRTVALPVPPEGKPAWIQCEFAQPFRAQAFSIAMAAGQGFFGATPPNGQLQASQDGTSWVTLVNLPGPEPPGPSNAKSNVVDLTAKMGKDGALDWDVPAGRWVVLRMGYSLTGEKNHPATPEATGYEVDKLSRKHVDAYFQNYVGQVEGAL